MMTSALLCTPAENVLTHLHIQFAVGFLFYTLTELLNVLLQKREVKFVLFESPKLLLNFFRRLELMIFLSLFHNCLVFSL